MKIKSSIINTILSFVAITVLSCSTDADEPAEMQEDTVNFQFLDGFETDTNDFMNLFPNDGSRWTGTQLVNPNGAENTLALSTVQKSEGSQSLRVDVKQSDNILSKVDIEKSGFQASENSTVIIEADFYIDSDANIENLLLIDLECCSCWDPTVPDNQCPGIRLAMTGGNDYLSIERGKITGNTLTQTSFEFPRGEWVNVRWQMQLSTDNSGSNELYINDQQVISENGMNMPNPEIFRSLFAEEGIDFELQQPVVYERVQVGATANPDAEDLVIYVDNFSINVAKN